MLYIFGAHSRARTLAAYIRFLEPDKTICGFLVDNDEENPDEVDGVKVIDLKTSKTHNESLENFNFLEERENDGACDARASLGLDTSLPVYIATRGIYHEGIESRLKELGFKNIIKVTPAFDMEIRNKYLTKYYLSLGKRFAKIDDLKPAGCGSCTFKDDYMRGNACVYVAKTAFDTEPKLGYYLPAYANFLQVGTALTDKRIKDSASTDEEAVDEQTRQLFDSLDSAIKAGLPSENKPNKAVSNKIKFDNTGDNISEKNKQFCELTGLYWIWKNASEDYVGLEHYRRHFILPDDWLQRVIDNDVDLILPIPLYVSPSVEENYKGRHVASDWDFVMDYLKEHHPKDYAFAKDFFKGNLYSPCNMFIGKKPVIDAFCEWLFPILFALEERNGVRDDNYQNRYPGFISERLLTMYFARREDEIKRVYADKNFLS